MYTIDELRNAKLTLEHAWARINGTILTQGDKDAQGIIRWAIFDVAEEIRFLKQMDGGTK